MVCLALVGWGSGVPETKGADWDFSKGSDVRLFESFEKSQEAHYHEIVAAYGDEGLRRPEDAKLAVERVRFIENFVWSEDFFIESAEADYEVAKAELLERFPTAVSTVLYRMGSYFADEFEELVEVNEPRVSQWSAEERGEFYWYRTLRSQNEGDSAATYRFASLAFLNRPNPESAVMLAQSHLLVGDKAKATAVLQHASFAEAEPWYLKSRMDLWFEMGDIEAALRDFEVLSASKEPYLVANEDTAGRMVAARLVEQAREALAAIGVNDWNAIAVLRHRLEFERQHGTAETGKAAYEALRDKGWWSDPLVRRRVGLFQAFPEAGWEWRDLGGFLGLGGIMLILAAVPGVLLIPAHYWGLGRRVSGKPPELLAMSWTLRDAWGAGAVLIVASALALWAFEIERLESYFDEQFTETPLLMKNMVGFVAVSWGAMIVSLGWLMRKRKTWAVFTRGRWNWGEILGVAFGTFVVLRIALGVYLGGQRALATGGLAQASPMISQLLVALQEQVGPVGMLVCIAGLVPVLEELYFRGVILSGLMRHIPFWAANLTQATLFGLVHESVMLFPFYLALGMIAGGMTKKSESLWPGILLHVFNNLLSGIMVIALSP
jgi:membrane protease YdiL (CAAX protease family)